MSPAARLLAAALLLAGCAGAQRGGDARVRVVEAEGWASYDARDPEGSRRRALADAQRKAAEQVNGVTVSASSLVAEAVSVRARVMTETAGGVLDWRVLASRVEGGFLRLLIRAKVLERPAGLPAQWPPLGLLARVIVESEGIPEPLRQAAASALRRELMARGFSVAPPDSPAPCDIAISARVEIRPVRDPRLGSFRSCLAVMTLRAADASGREVLWEGVREAAALDLEPEDAGRKAVEAAAAVAGRDAASGLARLAWQRR